MLIITLGIPINDKENGDKEEIEKKKSDDDKNNNIK